MLGEKFRSIKYRQREDLYKLAAYILRDKLKKRTESRWFMMPVPPDFNLVLKK